jgi:hypothetical protein
MKRDFVKIYANKSKYLGKEVALSVYLYHPVEMMGHFRGYIAPTYPDIPGGLMWCDLGNLPNAGKELAISSSGKVLTFRGKLKSDAGLGPILYATDVRLMDTSNWPKP